MTAVSGVSVVRRQSIRVALSATIVVGVIYALVATAVIAFATVDLTRQIDDRITQAFGRLPGGDGGGGQRPPDSGFNPGEDPGRPLGFRVFAWTVQEDGTVLANSNQPALPAELTTVSGPVTATIDGTQVRIAGTMVGTNRVVLAQSLEFVHDAQRTILLGSLLIAPFLLGGVFVGAVVIGRRTAAPIEAARRRQLEFTADASHELRTPLSVIEAHTSLALAAERDAAWYRNAFSKIDRESKRMRRLLEDMLWLARFDAAATPKITEPVDLGTLARQAADRFAAVAETRRLGLAVNAPDAPVVIAASPDLVDRLIGVLVDNACKYAPEGGRVDVTVGMDAAGRACVTVDDSGPGIRDEDRDRIFDRFHRSVVTSSEAGGAGLGLAIGDAIVRATGGRWAVEPSPLGGARFAVSWPKGSLAA
jgi:signal transduction histidine kinase